MNEPIESWKGIAEYLRRGTRTVQRWEREEGLPVHRLQHEKLGSVYAFREELDAWWKSRGNQLENEPAPAENRVPSIGVLPFADLSREQDQEYFCDGIAEEIIGTLSRIRSVRVTSRSSSFRFRGKSADLAAVGRQLKVATLLEGSVRKQQNSLRVTVQLIDVASGYHLWSGSYDRTMGDVFAIQEDIARAVAESLEVTLTVPESAALARVPTRNPQAHDLYLRGRAFYYRYGPQDMECAIQLFLQATTLDDAFAPAWAGLADCWSYLYLYSERSDVLKEQAAWASHKALELDPDSAQACASVGLARFLRGDPDADADFERATQLDPNLFEAWYFRARYAFSRGLAERALRFYQEALRVRPDDYQSPLLMAQILDDQGRKEEARTARRSGIARAQEHLSRYPDDVRALYCTANGMAALGEAAPARELCERALAMRPNDGMVLYNVGCVYALIGCLEEAMNAVEQAAKCGLREKGWYQHDSNLDPLRTSPRFQRLIAGL